MAVSNIVRMDANADPFTRADDNFYQAALRIDGAPAIRLVVERLVPARHCPDGWDWMIWQVPGRWRQPSMDWHGTAVTLDAAKRQALAAAHALLVSMTTRDGLAASA